jgi:hypothetical protein
MTIASATTATTTMMPIIMVRCREVSAVIVRAFVVIKVPFYL